jgi:hypothetical protein
MGQLGRYRPRGTLGAPPLQLRVRGEDSLVQHPQFPAGLHTELIDEELPRVPERGQRVGLTPAPI